MDDPGAQPNPSAPHERLWTPWRMPYIDGGAREDGCVFCNRLSGSDDVSALVLRRDQHTFTIMNLFPYNTGHVMVVPNAHIAAVDEATPETLAALGTSLGEVIPVLQRVLRPQGFNVGLNVGSVAGAGVAAHLHQHIVPRWLGDANFMPILASTTVIPELIPVTCAKLRAEFGRDGFDRIGAVVLDPAGGRVLIPEAEGGPAIPTGRLETAEAAWTAAVSVARSHGVAATVAGWAGPARADVLETPALTLRAIEEPAPGAPGWYPLEEARALLAGSNDLVTLDRAIAQLAPAS